MTKGEEKIAQKINSCIVPKSSIATTANFPFSRFLKVDKLEEVESRNSHLLLRTTPINLTHTAEWKGQLSNQGQSRHIPRATYVDDRRIGYRGRGIGKWI